MNTEKINDIVFGLILGTLGACALMFALFMLYAVFMLIWTGAGIVWALAYLVGVITGGGIGVKPFT